MLAPVKAYKDYWTVAASSAIRSTSRSQEKLELLRDAAAEAKKNRQQVFIRRCTLSFPHRRQILRFVGGFVHPAAQSAELRHRQCHRRRCGQGSLQDPSIPAAARYRRLRIRRRNEPDGKCAARSRRGYGAPQAPPVTAGKKDLVLLPSHLWLTIHECIGHSTELDRALGYEANYAGTSFLTADKLGKQRVGSDLDQHFRRPHQREGPRHRRLRR